jgi:hypothetical protein
VGSGGGRCWAAGGHRAGAPGGGAIGLFHNGHGFAQCAADGAEGAAGAGWGGGGD